MPASPRRLRCADARVLGASRGGLLRLWMLHHFFEASGDSLVYGDIAKNLLLHGRYAFTLARASFPDLDPAARLSRSSSPLCFQALRHRELLPRAVWVQIALELAAASCSLISRAALRPPQLQRGARMATLWLAALCPFTASMPASPLTEALTLFVAGAGALVHGPLSGTARAGRLPSRLLLPSPLPRYCVPMARWSRSLLRRALFARAAQRRQFVHTSAARRTSHGDRLRSAGPCPICRMDLAQLAGLSCLSAARAALRHRSRRTHTPGWERWVKTWCLDFVSTYNVYWNVPGDDARHQPAAWPRLRLAAQYGETAALAADYNANGDDLTPEIDARFARWPRQRIAAHPLRYYVWPAPGPRRRYVAAAPRRKSAHRPRLVGLRASPRRNRFSWAYAGAECALSVARRRGLLPAAAILGADAGLHSAAQRTAAHRRTSRGPLHAGVLSHAVRARRRSRSPILRRKPATWPI